MGGAGCRQGQDLLGGEEEQKAGGPAGAAAAGRRPRGRDERPVTARSAALRGGHLPAA